MTNPQDSGPIAQLVADFQSDQSTVREQARQTLVKFGSSATAALSAALTAEEEQVRWEAAKTLAETRDPAATPALVTALRDDEQDVRWAAGNALIQIGEPAVPAVLTELMKKADPVGLYPAARYVLRHLAAGALAAPLDQVLQAFKTSESEIAVPVAAGKAYEQLSG